MTDSTWLTGVEGISLPELRRFLISSGFTTMGSWGKYLERFQLAHDHHQFDILVPTTTEISDYKDRIRDALIDMERALSENPAKLIRKVSLGGFKIFRVRAHPGAEISSLPFDEGYALLSNSKNLIKASAVSAFSARHRKVIRGRSATAVDEYMDRIRIGQSDIGSYVFNLLLPSDDSFFDNDIDADENSDAVVISLKKNIELAAEMAETKRVPAADRLESAGMSANFCEALYNLIDWSENIILEVSDHHRSKNLLLSHKFERNILSVLERTAFKLAPEEQPVKTTISGTITRLSEPASRRRGSIDLLSKIDGRRRSVRIAFEPNDRDTIITAFKEKSSRLLSVSGFLRTERNGHLALDKPEQFDASKRGSLL